MAGGLFGNLPPPSAPQIEDQEINEQPESKRAKTEVPVQEKEELIASPPSAATEQPAVTEQPAIKQPPQPTVLAALHRITSHISNPKKFCKASELLRQLLSQPDTLDPTNRSHGAAVFTALVASMEQDPTRSNDPLLAREYSKLFTVASKHPELFTAPQRAQLDVYGIWAVMLNQLLVTDDSFMFSKTVTKIKEMISELPVLEFPEQIAEEENALVSPYQFISTSAVVEKHLKIPSPEDGEVVEVIQDVGEDVESRVWNDVAVVAYRREALARCISSVKESYLKVWARTSIDLLVDHASKNSSQRFLPEQRKCIEDMVAFVKEQKVARKTKGGGGGDATAFERAGAAYSKANMSHRGGVGSGGDHKSEAWLG